MSGDDVMARAREIARHAHAGQVDKAGRDYYRTHVADVVHRVGNDATLQAVAYLHDVVEDTSWTLDDLTHVGFPDEVVAAVDAITHRPHENRLAYYARVKANSIALAVKLADLASNTDPQRLAMLSPSTRTRLIAKYERAKVELR